MAKDGTAGAVYDLAVIKFFSLISIFIFGKYKCTQHI